MNGFIPLLALDYQFPLASRQRIQWRRSRQASGIVERNEPSTLRVGLTEKRVGDCDGGSVFFFG